MFSLSAARKKILTYERTRFSDKSTPPGVRNKPEGLRRVRMRDNHIPFLSTAQKRIWAYEQKRFYDKNLTPYARINRSDDTGVKQYLII